MTAKINHEEVEHRASHALMTIDELMSNESLRRHEFPVAAEKIFLAHAGVCPLPRRVAEAIRVVEAESSLAATSTLLDLAM